ncbi:MAG: T9SS type A sorting domain-containing protein [bacterium]|nr:T9SS type A sorting domain-containing protein [bacterium]
MTTPRCRFVLPALAMLGLALAVVAPAGVATATPPGYLIVDIGVVQPADIASQGFRVSMTGIATGRSFGNPTRAFTWTSAGGLVGLPNLAGRTYCVGNGVNDLGDVVGTGATTSFGSSPLPVLWQGGLASQLPLPAGQSFGRANDVNNAGLAVGSIGSGSVEYGVKWSGGVASVITAQTAGGCFLRTAFSVNDAGLVAGFGVDPANAARNVGFVYDAATNTATEVPPLLGHNGALAFDVSNAGHIVGSSMLNQGSGMPFIWSAANGTKEIALPPATSQGSARGVNNAGWAVGTAGGLYAVPFLYDGENTYSLADLLPAGSDWDLDTNTSSSAMGISEDGVIVGTGVHAGATRAYAMVPDGAVAAMLQEFRAEAHADGIALSWSLAITATDLGLVVERAPTAAGPWSPIEAVVTGDGRQASVVDTTAEPGRTWHYRLRVTEGGGATYTLGALSAERPLVVGGVAELGAPWPNPARDDLQVAYRLPSAQGLVINVHDVRGRLVRSLVDASLGAGEYTALWDGRADDGTRAPAGVYFITLRTAQAARTQRLVLTR